MKLTLIAVILAGFTGLGTVAQADEFYGPPGEAPIAGQPVAQPMRGQRGQRGQQGPGNGEMHRALLDRFDRNHDGRLEPRERRQAARALRRMAQKLARQERRQGRMQQQGRQGQAGGRQAPGGPNVDVYVE